MKIYLTTGRGTGQTLLSSFDAALFDAGVHNYNLLTLSSVIPPDAKIIFHKYPPEADEWGHKLYVVKAEIRSREVGKYIGAALGWVQLEDGRGVFVEHEEIGETKAAVESSLAEDIKSSLADLCRTRKLKLDHKKFKIRSNIVKVANSPTCALVIAVYQSQSWK